MEHLLLKRIRFREQEDFYDHSFPAARPPLLQHVVLGGAGSLYQLQLQLQMQCRHTDRRAEIRQEEWLFQCRAVVLSAEKSNILIRFYHKGLETS